MINAAWLPSPWINIEEHRLSDTYTINGSGEQDKWTRFIVLSLVLHLVVFSAFFLGPGDPPMGLTDREVVYKVDLVDLSEESQDVKTVSGITTNLTGSPEGGPAKRIYSQNKRSEALKIAKRTSNRKQSNKPKKLTTNQMLDSALSAMKKDATAKGGNFLDKAISELEKKAGTGKPETAARAAAGDVEYRLYIMEAEARVKSNWSYPVARGGSKKLEAVIVLTVNRDGTILKTRFVRRSGDNLFDESVLQAIEKSEKVPPLPEGIDKNNEELEIIFNLEDLEQL